MGRILLAYVEYSNGCRLNAVIGDPVASKIHMLIGGPSQIKKFLISCLQFLHNFITQNEQRKLLLWLDLFANSRIANEICIWGPPHGTGARSDCVICSRRKLTEVQKQRQGQRSYRAGAAPQNGRVLQERRILNERRILRQDTSWAKVVPQTREEERPAPQTKGDRLRWRS